jgi:DNA-directed RNA polymerase subunit M
MEFCPKCGMRLTVTIAERKGKKVLLKCLNCGYESKSKKKAVIHVSKTIEHAPKEPIVIIGEKEAKLKTLPTEKVECPKCENKEAYVWLVQTRGADESSTQFFRCTKCGVTWREYS